MILYLVEESYPGGHSNEWFPLKADAVKAAKVYRKNQTAIAPTREVAIRVWEINTATTREALCLLLNESSSHADAIAGICGVTKIGRF